MKISLVMLRLKTGLFLSMLLLGCSALSGQDVSLEMQKSLRMSESARIARWSREPDGIQSGFSTSSLRFPCQFPPDVPIHNTWKVKAWINEKVSTQLLIWSKEETGEISWEISDLTAVNGSVIGKECHFVGAVQYVMTDEFSEGCGYRKAENFDSSLVADIIRSDIQHSRLERMSTQPVWLGIQVPANAAAGVYKGAVSVITETEEHVLNIELEVLDRRLPDAKERTFQLDLWQHPAAIARIHHLKMWSDEHFDAMRSYYTLLAEIGQKAITAGIVDEPWNHQTYDDYPGLVKWIKKRDGSWSYDYSLFDKYISFVMSCGITGRINCYSMIPWKIEFTYFDEASGKDELFTHQVGTPAYNTFWTTMLQDFTAHLKEKGWFHITAIAMDERSMDAMKSVIELLKNIDPQWKISLAGDNHPGIEADIYDYCLASRFIFSDKVLKVRREQGKLSTWYTCCTEPYPNLFSFSPPDEGIWIGWYTAAAGFDGYLRWAFNSWTADPVNDSRFIAWPAGDTYQIYPGPLSSIRFEKLNEGIQDFEKIRILKESYRKNNEIGKLNRLETELEKFSIEVLSKITATQMLDVARPLLNE